MFVELPHGPPVGAPIELTFLDDASGEVVSLLGEVVRVTENGVGIQLVDPPAAWRALVHALSARHRDETPTLQLRVGRRLRVLVVGDDDRRRSALALYVTSGWDVRFASDLSGAQEALASFRCDAVVVEHDLSDPRWPPLLEAVRLAQPAARRIIRTDLGGGRAPPPGTRDDLVHRVVDASCGLEAVLDALSADWESGGPPPPGGRDDG